jgi:hypothetical protein
MSYDLQIWSVRPLDQDAFRHPEMWQKQTSAWILERKNWQIVVSSSDKVTQHDIPEEIRGLLPGIEWLTNINLEGKATAEAHRLAQSSATDIARWTHGAVLDQQDGSIRLPSGVKRFLSPRSKETFDVLSLSWWFLHGSIESRQGREQFVGLLEQMMPEALPKRYGLYEPPQHRYIETGKDHFLRFLDENLHDQVVWYPHRPVVGVDISLPNPVGPNKLGFRTNHLSIDLEKVALSQPGWATTVQRFWKEVSRLIRPIYGDVRVLGNYGWMGATVSSGQQHPVRSWWWAGIPHQLGRAVVIGETYQNLWPKLVANAEVIDGLAFASVGDWNTDADLADKIGEPPPEQVQLPQRFGSVMTIEEHREFMAAQKRGESPDRRVYPPGWPFGAPFPT